MTGSSLFGVPQRRRGRVERAAEQVLARWRRDGVDVDELTSSLLRGFGQDVDTAERDHERGDLSRYSVARIRGELLRAYRELGPVELDDDTLGELFTLPGLDETSDDVSEPARHS